MAIKVPFDWRIIMIGYVFCSCCGADLDAIGSDNVSPVSGFPLCEECKDEMIKEDCFDEWIQEQELLNELDEW